RDGLIPASANVNLRLEDGTDYGQTGKVEFAEAVVDPQTGTVTLRARFPNPQGLLRPGMFVRAQFAQAIDTSAYLVPQQA
ncbi:efflux RND transporter periplasmic adaptor subunit, partial [Paenibacillus polymyxa]|nr:efflux RND transporter periplasmic adaptor subunit [Paenibacillus polymyxa]